MGGEGSGYWERHDGARHFMHHLNGCNGKLWEGSLGAIEELDLRSSDVTSADATLLAAILKRTRIFSLKCASAPPPAHTGGHFRVSAH